MLYVNEVIFDDSTPEEAHAAPEGYGTGFTGRQPEGYGAAADSVFPPELLIPESEWQARIEEKEANGTQLSAQMIAAGLPCKNQQQTDFCFPAGTMIRMGDGSQKRIEDVRVLDSVVTAEGNVKKVLHTMVRFTKEPLITPVMWGHSHLKATSEHPILTKRGYVALKDLVPGDKVAFPKFMAAGTSILQTEEFFESRRYARREKRSVSVKRGVIPGKTPGTFTTQIVPDVLQLTEKLGRVVGFFLAEGHTSNWNTCWSFNRTETDTFASEVVDNLRSEAGAESSIRQTRNNVALVTLQGRDWAVLFEKFGETGANRKRLHSSLTSGPKEFLNGILTSWMDGDRQIGTNGVSVSRELALNMFDIANAMGHLPILSTHTKDRIDSRGQHHQHAWKVGWGDKGKPNHGTEQDDRWMWRKVYDLESEPFEGYVFNLEVEGDHSYVAEGVGVHNCWCNAPTHCIEILRVQQNEPMVILSPASVACPQTNFKNVGGWGKNALLQIIGHGAVPVDNWPANAIDRKYATKDNAALAMNYRVVKWADLTPRNTPQLISLLLRDIPVAVAYNWWGHEVTAYDAVWVNGQIGVRDRNSWGMSYGHLGFFVLQGSKMLADDAVAPMTALAT